MTWNTPQEFVDALNTVLNDSQSLSYDPQSDESLTHCLVCGEWEGHTELCPVPAITLWLAADNKDMVEPDIDMDGSRFHQPTWEVVVGNLGTVYSDTSKRIARKTFHDYCELATLDGRVSGESVTLLKDGEIVDEQSSTNTDTLLFASPISGGPGNAAAVAEFYKHDPSGQACPVCGAVQDCTPDCTARNEDPEHFLNRDLRRKENQS